MELAKGGGHRGAPPRGSVSRYESNRGYGGGYGGGISRRTDYRVCVTGLPKTCSWQDLKDFMRKAGDVTFTQVPVSDIVKCL